MSAFKTLGRYEILKELGRGGMGIVLKGRDPKIDRLVALKIIKLDDIGDTTREQELLERFYIEARAAGKLAHPNIVTIYDVGEEEGKSFIAMEFVEGRDLSDVIGETGLLPFERATELVTQIADGLAFAHDRGIVHRDIKPGNILLQSDDHVKITDFGLARLQSAGSVTQTGHAVGSPSYMSPEQVQGLPVDGRSDIFSLGVMYYELLTGKRPFDGESLTSIIFKIIKEDPVPPSKMNSDLPLSVDKVVAKMTAKDPAERYQSCKDVAKDLKRMLAAKDEPFNLTESDAGRTMDFARGDVTLDVKSVRPAKEAEKKGGGAKIAVSLIVLVMLAAGGWYVYTTQFQKGKTAPIVASRATAPEPSMPPAEKADKKKPPAPQPESVVAAKEEPAATEAKKEESQKLASAVPPVKEPRAPKPADVTINVESSVKGKAYVDGKPAGDAPGRLKLSLIPGEHTVEVRAEGYAPWEKRVSVEEGKPVKVSAAPGLASGTLLVSTDPGGADIWIDKKKTGKAPLVLAGLSTGSHKIRAAMRGYKDMEKSVSIRRDRPTTLDITLSKITQGSLHVESSPSGADVYVDKRRVGKAPVTVGVDKGRRQLLVRLDGYKDYTSAVSVEPGNKESVNAVLEQFGRGVVIVNARPWADVYFNGEKIGTTPPAIEREQTEGELKVRLENPAYVPFEREYAVEKDKRLEITHLFTDSEALVQEKKVGTLKIISGKESGMVFIDGKLYGKTPLEVTGIVVGSHNIVVKRAGLSDYKRKVRIEAGIVSRIEVP